MSIGARPWSTTRCTDAVRPDRRDHRRRHPLGGTSCRQRFRTTRRHVQQRRKPGSVATARGRRRRRIGTDVRTPHPFGIPRHQTRCRPRWSAVGRYVNTASVAALQSGYGPHPYGTAKATVIQLTRTAAVELAPRRIRVNAVIPGGIATRITGAPPDVMRRGLDAFQPYPRLGEASDIAEVVLFLASDRSEFITGETDQGRWWGSSPASRCQRCHVVAGRHTHERSPAPDGANLPHLRGVVRTHPHDRGREGRLCLRQLHNDVYGAGLSSREGCGDRCDRCRRSGCGGHSSSARR